MLSKQVWRTSSIIAQSGEKRVEFSDPPKLRQNMVKVIDPPWYKPVVSKVVASTSISKMDELQRQEAQVSVPTPRDDKSTKVFSSTRVQKTTGPEYRRDDAFLGVLLLHHGLGQPDDEAVTVVDVLCICSSWRS